MSITVTNDFMITQIHKKNFSRKVLVEKKLFMILTINKQRKDWTNFPII